MIWKRYFLKELLKVFILFIGSIYFLYILIDYSAHTKTFHYHVPFTETVLYYAYQFTKRADILIPVALMISTIKILTTLNMRNEIVAMTVGGVPIAKLMRPFLSVAFFFTILLYLNFQFLQPIALNQLHAFENSYFKVNALPERQVHSLVLADNTLLIYRYFDQAEQAFIDTYWLKNTDEIYHIQSLHPYEKKPLGYMVDHLIRNSSGELIRQASFEDHLFPQMEFEKKALYNVVHPIRWQSMSQLFSHLNWKKIAFGMKRMHDKEAEAITYLLYKLIVPFVCILAVIAPAPFCLRFGRHLPVFGIYALSLFGIVSFFTLVNSSVILGESQVIPPLIAVTTIPALFFLFSGWKYAKI